MSGRKKGQVIQETEKNPAVDKNCYIAVRKNLSTAVWVLRDKTEYHRLLDLYDEARYSSKLLTHYGYDKRIGEFNLDQFPITKTDAHMEGIKSDIDRAFKSLDDLERYKEYLARKYDILADVEEADQCRLHSIYCPRLCRNHQCYDKIG